uniref:Phage late control D family protein n=1 Tax=Caldilinea aerophila TaxID=133453 RepID=A0A7C1JZ13_9CHLR
MFNFLGVHLTLLIGPTVAIPAPPLLTEALHSVEVTHSDEGRSGFQLVFQAGRDAMTGLIDYPLLSLPLLRPFNRVVLIVTFNGIPSVLMDGVITHQQLNPSREPGTGQLTVTGEDVSVMMDLEEKSAEHPAQDETIIALKLIASYAQYGLIPMVIPPTVIDPPIPIERTPVQQGTDLEYLQQMAARHGYVFFVIPGPAPLTNIAYWGPPKRLDIPQPALSVNLGPATNVESINFQYSALEPTLVSGEVQDRLTGQSLPVRTFASMRLPLSSQPAWLTQQPNVRTRAFRESGLNAAQAFGRAQSVTDASVDRVLTATGELNALRYGGLLRARGVVGVRGAGYSYSGFYYIKRVTHKLSRGEYKQQFTLVRDGLGALTPVVPP